MLNAPAGELYGCSDNWMLSLVSAGTSLVDSVLVGIAVVCGDVVGSSTVGGTAHPAKMSKTNCAKQNCLITIRLFFERFFIGI